MTLHRRVLPALWLAVLLVAAPGTLPAQAEPEAIPAVQNVTILTPTLAVFDRFEVQFDLSTAAANLDLPYDPAPPPGQTPGSGVSVDALLSADNWATTIVQPAFFYQPFTYAEISGTDHLVPSGPPRWLVRFTPQVAGTWQLRLRAVDAGGSNNPSAQTWNFTVSGASANPNLRHGFLRVSQTDPRYFEFQDGSPFLGAGFDSGFQEIGDTREKLALLQQNKINFLRVWMSGAGINGSQWTAWASHHLPGDAYLPGVLYDTQNTYAGGDVAWKLDNSNPCLFAGYSHGRISVQPNTIYVVQARVKVSNVTGPATGGSYGFTIKTADWLGTNCDKPNPGHESLITTPLAGTSDWTEVSGVITTSSGQNFLNLLYLSRHNASGGEVSIDSVRLYRQGDPDQVNLLPQPQANSHTYFDRTGAYFWDQFIEAAGQRGVYLKLVIDEKNEWIRDHIGADGEMTATGSNDNFYAAPNTRVRWLQQAWWRYLIARWGYSPAIHSFEYINEGDPYNGNHYNAANAMAQYIHDHDPSRHMGTTSFWAAFPNAEFWSRTAYPAIDYADLHQYVNQGDTQSFLAVFPLETNPANIHTGNGAASIPGTLNNNAAITPRGLVIRERGEWIVRYWMKASSFSASCPYSGSGGMQRIRWQIDGGTFAGGKEGVVPTNSQGQDFVCTSPGGTFGWTQFSSDRDRSGAAIPQNYRLVINDDLPHEISLRLENSNGTGGQAWIDDVELVSPSGKVSPVIGQFDATSIFADTAWFGYSTANLMGGSSPVGAHKPFVLGETGLTDPSQPSQTWNPDLNRDSQGDWLHDLLWSQTGPGGVSFLVWWASETIEENGDTGRVPALYSVYLTWQNFMQGIPVNNGRYQDAQALSSNANLRAWGQRDAASGRAHLWIQNKLHTWREVVDGTSIPAQMGTITLSGMPSGQYRAEWWDTHSTANPIFHTDTFLSNGTLTLTLPSALQSDVAVKIEMTAPVVINYDKAIFLPLVRR